MGGPSIFAAAKVHRQLQDQAGPSQLISLQDIGHQGADNFRNRQNNNFVPYGRVLLTRQQVNIERQQTDADQPVAGARQTVAQPEVSRPNIEEHLPDPERRVIMPMQQIVPTVRDGSAAGISSENRRSTLPNDDDATVPEAGPSQFSWETLSLNAFGSEFASRVKLKLEKQKKKASRKTI